MKACTRCGEVKPLEDFNRESKNRDGRRASCRACDCERMRRYDEAIRERRRRYLAKNAEAIAERSRRYREANAEAERARLRRYRESEAGRLANRAAEARRRARKASAFIADLPWQAIAAKTGGRCMYCPRPATTVDHLRPLARGGQHEPANLVPACASCNASKCDRILYTGSIPGGLGLDWLLQRWDSARAEVRDAA